MQIEGVLLTYLLLLLRMMSNIAPTCPITEIAGLPQLYIGANIRYQTFVVSLRR